MSAIATDRHSAVEQAPGPATGVVAVAIPSFNEDRFIGSVVLKALRHADRVIVIDDGSADRTAEVAQAAGAVVVRHDTNRGKASAINTAFHWAVEHDVAALVLIDGDGQHDPDQIPDVVRPVLDGTADMVVGTRFGAEHSRIPSYRQAGQHVLTTMTNLSSGLAVSDSQSGYRAFSRRALQRMKFRTRRFAIESEMQFIAKQEHLTVAEVPIRAIYAEPAKRNPVKHGVSILHGLLDMLERQRPLLSFGLVGMLLLAAGVGLGLHVTTVYQHTHNLAVGFAILTGMLVIVGMFTSFVGIILHSMRVLLQELKDG